MSFSFLLSSKVSKFKGTRSLNEAKDKYACTIWSSVLHFYCWFTRLKIVANWYALLMEQKNIFYWRKNYKQNSTQVITHIWKENNIRMRISRRFSLVFTFEHKQTTNHSRYKQPTNQQTNLRDITISNNNKKYHQCFTSKLFRSVPLLSIHHSLLLSSVEETKRRYSLNETEQQPLRK